jgi:hypothetical protein
MKPKALPPAFGRAGGRDWAVDVRAVGILLKTEQMTFPKSFGGGHSRRDRPTDPLLSSIISPMRRSAEANFCGINF